MLLLFHGKQPSCYESIGASQRQWGCEKKSQGESEKEIKEWTAEGGAWPGACKSKSTASRCKVLMAAAPTDQITAWFMSPHGVLLKVSYQHLLLVADTVVVIIVFMFQTAKIAGCHGLWVSTLCNSHYTVHAKDAPVLIQLWSRDGLCLKLDHEGREAKPAEEGEREGERERDGDGG